jgi:hypothetical protein
VAHRPNKLILKREYNMRHRTRAAAGISWTIGLFWLLELVLIERSFAAEPTLFAKPDAFQTLVNPNCSHCIDEAKSRAGDLRGDDPVLAWTRGKYEGGAIPIRFFLNPYRVISDTYGVFVFDPDAGFARGYEPSLDFTFYGWRNGIAVMRHKDGTLFSTLSGRAFDGPRKGEQLKPIATLSTTWGYWNKAYPASVAYRMFEKYQPIELPGQANADSKQTRASVDRRLPENEDVLGVSLAGTRKAYPLNAMPNEGGVIRDKVSGQDVAIFWYPSTRTAAAYATRVDEADATKSVKLEFNAADPAAPFIDRESGSRFGVEGRAVSGPLKGKTLTWIDSVQCKWFAWAAENPKTEIHSVAKGRPIDAGRDPKSAIPAKTSTEMVIVVPDAVTPRQIANWRGEGFTAIVVLLSEDHSADSYRAAATAASSAKMEVFYWIEVARNKHLADAHPRWMASLGMHDDWLARFPSEKMAKKGEVAKAYPWVPIGYTEAFQAHVGRIGQLLGKVPDTYRGLLLNDLQGGPASCGCGNLKCRWAIDYGVPATATRDGADHTAARFIGKVRDLAPGKQIIPIWMTECEERDLPTAMAPGGKSTGLCGSVPCATGTCPRAFANQLKTIMDRHEEPLGLLIAQQACGRDATFYDGPAGWISASVDYLDNIPLAPTRRGVPHEQLWLVVQGVPKNDDTEATARAEALKLQPGAVIVARIPVDQSYEPRMIAID